MIIREFNERNLEEAFFPVEEQPIYSVSRKIIPGYKAIVDSNTGRTLSVVSNQYCLIKNIEAYNYANYIVREVFEGKSLQDFMCYNIIMPNTKGSCRIDLLIPNVFNKLFGDKKESWTPFVRISNSYNKTLALKYEIGFCRWICLNGVIFGQTGVSISAAHMERITYKEIDRLIAKARSSMGNISSLWKAFELKMEELRSIHLSSSSAMGIYCRVFDVKAKNSQITQLQREGLICRAEQFTRTSREYFNELGDNAYAMMNVLTDIASFPEWTKSPANYIDGYQRRVGKWVDDITTEYKKKGFNLSDYIGADYINTAKFMESLIK